MPNTKKIITCEDGFKFQVVTAKEGLELFKADKEVFVLDDSNFEYLIKDESEFDVINRTFVIEAE